MRIEIIYILTFTVIYCIFIRIAMNGELNYQYNGSYIALTILMIKHALIIFLILLLAFYFRWSIDCDYCRWSSHGSTFDCSQECWNFYVCGSCFVSSCQGNFGCMHVVSNSWSCFCLLHIDGVGKRWNINLALLPPLL